MKKRIKRIEIGLVILLLLTTINTITSFSNSKNSTNESEEEKIELPEQLTKEVLNKTVYSIKNAYNNSNWDDLYNVFGEYAKAQLNHNDVQDEFKKLSSLTEKIGTYAYSHYTYLGKENDADWFDIFYKCSFSIGGNGTIKLRYRVTDQKNFEVVGLNINLEDI